MTAGRSRQCNARLHFFTGCGLYGKTSAVNVNQKPCAFSHLADRHLLHSALLHGLLQRVAGRLQLDTMGADRLHIILILTCHGREHLAKDTKSLREPDGQKMRNVSTSGGTVYSWDTEVEPKVKTHMQKWFKL